MTAPDTKPPPEEIAAEALAQFDLGGDDPSVESLAAAFGAEPAEIAAHLPGRPEIIRAAVSLVWNEALTELLKLVPRPFEAEPRRVLVAMGIVTRRAWLRHFRLAPYLAASPEVDDFTRDSIGLMANLLERVGLEGEKAARAFHSYTSFMIGSVLFATARMSANEQLGVDTDGYPARRFRTEHTPGAARRSSEDTRQSIDQIMDLSDVDPARDEELYARGLQRLVESLTAID